MNQSRASEQGANRRLTPSRWVHVITGLVTVACFLVSVLTWRDLLKDAVQSFGTVGLFLTAYGVLFSVVEVLRTQSATLAAGEAAERAANLARSPYDMRDVAECATTIETSIYAMQHGGVPRSQPLSRIIRLYTAIFDDRYDDDRSVERMRIGVVQSHVAVSQRSKKDMLLEQTLAEMLSDLSARGGHLIAKANET